MFLLYKHFAELLSPIEKVLYMFGDFITTGTDGGADACINIVGLTIELFAHCLYSGSSDPTSGTAPSRMRYPCHTLYGVIE